MVDHLVAIHANAVIGDGQGTVLFVERDANAEIAVTFIQLRAGERTETQLIRRIRGVGNQLTQEDESGIVGCCSGARASK
jgi:hypothetical protein